MKSIGTLILALALASAAEAQTSAQEITQKVKDGCQQELDTYCKAVAPGEGRVFACLYAYSDKLSGRCEAALYDAADRLEAAAAKLNACADDVAQYCADVKPGQGRVVDCLRQNQTKATPACRQAIDAGK